MEKIKRYISGSIEKLKNGSYILRQVARHRRNSQFIKNLAIIMSMLAVLLLIYGINFYTKTQNNINEQLENNNLNILDRVQDMGSETLKTAETIATNVAIKEYTRQYLLTSDEQSRKIYKENIDEMIIRYTSVYDFIDSIYVYSPDKKTVVYGQKYENKDVYSDASFLENYSDTNKITVIARKKRDVYPYLISIIRPVTVSGSVEDSYEYNEPLGVVCINLNAEKYGELLEKADYKKQSFPGVIIANNEYEILYSSQKDQIGLKTGNVPYLGKVNANNGRYTYRYKNDNERLIVSSNKSSYRDLIFVSIASATDPWEIFLKMLQYIFEGMIFVVFASVLAAGFLAYTAYKPIVRISQILDQDEAAMQSLALHEKSGEMQFIIDNILHNMQKKNEMESEIKERVVLLRKAMFTALQVQINPHFIYNTLENINWLAVKLAGNDNKVSSSVLTLAKLMRYSLETEGYFVTIGDEISNAKQYAELLKVRYPGVFEIEWNVSDEVLKENIIRLTLQPIIENAIQHGIRPKREKGLIEINCELKNGDICVSVVDDGVGMTQEEMENINNSLAEEYLLESKHVGLRNVNQRLKIVFGENYGLHLSNREDGKQGLAVLLSIPITATDIVGENELYINGKKFNKEDKES